jgi:hypothetical protein
MNCTVLLAGMALALTVSTALDSRGRIGRRRCSGEKQQAG